MYGSSKLFHTPYGLVSSPFIDTEEILDICLDKETV